MCILSTNNFRLVKYLNNYEIQKQDKFVSNMWYICYKTKNLDDALAIYNKILKNAWQCLYYRL